jgi:hypothetical protein
MDYMQERFKSSGLQNKTQGYTCVSQAYRFSLHCLDMLSVPYAFLPFRTNAHIPTHPPSLLLPFPRKCFPPTLKIRNPPIITPIRLTTPPQRIILRPAHLPCFRINISFKLRWCTSSHIWVKLLALSRFTTTLRTTSTTAARRVGIRRLVDFELNVGS